MTPSICIWDDLRFEDVSKIMVCENPDDLKRFAKENEFNEEQMSALFSIVKKTHEKAIETPYGNVEDTYNYFKSLLLCHSVKRPPFFVHLYHLHEITKISDYVTKTYFRHFKLYKYAFTPKILLNLSVNYEDLPDETDNKIEHSDTLIQDGDKVNQVDDASNEIIEDNSNEDLNDVDTQSEEPAAVTELKSIINSTIDEQVAKLRLTIDEKLKSNETNILSRINENNKSSLSPPKSEKRGKKK